MRFTDAFVRRPVLAIVANLLIVVAGLQALRSISIRQYPRIESATVKITTPYVGAASDLVRGFITVPIERAIAAADGIDYIESESVQGLSTINVRLKLNFNAATALADISTRVNQVRADLPPESEIPSISIEPSDAQIAAMYLSFGSPILEDNQVTDYLTRVVQPRLSALDGVQRADILGGRQYAMRAWLRPDRMTALGVSPSQVRDALAANNFLSAVGETKGHLVEVNLTAATDLRTADDFRKLVVKRDGDSLVRLGEIAQVVLGAEDYNSEVRFSGKRAVFMGIWVRPNANSLDVINRVRAEMTTIQRELPHGMDSAIAYDSTKYISSAVREVSETLGETVFIVMVVIFLFLGSFRTVGVPVVAIPLSLIGAVFLMSVMGFTLNLLTLLAVVLSVGLVVDDAIVVVENVERHVRDGMRPFDAAILSARELTTPIIAMTITLAAVYIPIGFQGGLTGALFREFAFTLAGAVTISGVVALTLSPVMSAFLVRPAHRSWFGQRVDRAFEWLRDHYVRALDRSLHSRRAVLLVWAVLSLAVIPMYSFAPKELAPNEDQGVVFTTLDVPANASLEQVMVYSDALHRIVEKEPEYDHSFQVTFPTTGFGGMLAVPWDERKRTIFPIQQELQVKAAAQLPGVRAPMFLPAPIPSAGLLPIEFVIASTANHEDIMRFVEEFITDAAASGQFAFPPIPDVRIDQAKTDILLDREKVGTMGLTMRDLGTDLSSMLSGNYVNRFNMDGRSYKVIPLVQRIDRLTADQLELIHVRGPDGRLLPLSTVAHWERSVEPRKLTRFQQLNSVKISGVPTRSVDGALKVLESTAARTLPPGYRIDYTGESRQLRTESGKFLPAMGLALILIFLVLAAQFDSFRDPLVILIGSVPLAMFGASIFTFLRFAGPPDVTFPLTKGWTTTLNIYSEVGLVTLVGLISKNGILIVEFANRQQAEGLDKVEAVRAAARTRFRPILMTTLATISGHFPLTLVRGPGAVARNSIGVVLVGGMAIGTLFTLFVVPSIYLFLARTHRKAAPEPELEGPPEPAMAPA
jgi:multidrug efflux pump